ncbi:MAG TPA: TlpA disulfide reductase family protein [Usitatibacter sp.]|nr:TlpA disulfide reductase family protein [Usitatibacter sp.]
MSRNGWVFAAVGLAAALAGTGAWLASRPDARPDITPGAFLAASFTDLQGHPRSLGQFQGRTLVVNFWATWCAPCREEIPALGRVQSRWGDKVQLVGLSAEEPGKVERYSREVAVSYPLWVGGDEVSEFARRLGNAAGVLPYTVVVAPSGEVVATKVGPYTEASLSEVLEKISSNVGQQPISPAK